MAWFRRGKQAEEPGVEGASAASGEPDTDTVGNPILERGARHSAPEGGPTRAELRMLQFVAEGRVARSAMGGASDFWKVDGAFATGTKATMLDWLLQEGYVELGQRTRISAPATLGERGRAVLEG